MNPELLRAALEADLRRLLNSARPIRYDGEGYRAVRVRVNRTISQQCEPGHDPYNNVGRSSGAWEACARLVGSDHSPQQTRKP